VYSVKKSVRGLGGKLLRREHGQALPEYALMLGLLLSLMFIAYAVGIKADQMFGWVVSALQ
jgi:Flp pilus assembly pilin Flp